MTFLNKGVQRNKNRISFRADDCREKLFYIGWFRNHFLQSSMASRDSPPPQQQDVLRHGEKPASRPCYQVPVFSIDAHGSALASEAPF